MPSTWSFELGACYAAVSTSLSLTPEEMQVMAALRMHRSAIVEAERKYGVSRHAIAGAIAWEILENPRQWSPRSGGMAKVHLYNYSMSGAISGAIIGGVAGPVGIAVGVAAGGLDFRTIAVEVEERGYLPKRTYEERRRLLATPEGSIEYVGAIMAAIADSAAKAGFEDIRGNPGILTNVYQQHTLATWEAHLAQKPPGTPFVPGNTMALWVNANRRFLDEAVGMSDISERRIEKAPATQTPPSNLDFLEPGSDVGVLP